MLSSKGFSSQDFGDFSIFFRKKKFFFKFSYFWFFLKGRGLANFSIPRRYQFKCFKKNTSSLELGENSLASVANKNFG